MKTTTLQRLTAFALTAVLVAPLSQAEENRTRRGTSLQDLARELEQVLGRDSVEIRGGRTRPTTTPRRDSPTVGARSTSLSIDALVDAMNRERAAHGLQPLRVNSRLSLAAADRIEDMFEQRYFDHVAPDGTQPFVWADRRGYRYSAIGENLAVGYRNANAVVSGWMNSPGHRRNILTSGFDEIGIGIAPGSPTRGYTGPTIVALYAAGG